MGPMSDGERDARFIQTLKPIPDYLDTDDVVTAEAWGKGWDLDGDALWATETHVSRLDAWTPKPSLATHVAIYHK